MPFVTIRGLPDGLSRDFLLDLRRDVTSTVVSSMGVKLDWVRVFFPADLLDQPQHKNDGCQTVYVTLETAMFHNASNDVELAKIALDTVTAIAKKIHNALDGSCEVEVFVLHLSPDLKIVIRNKN